MDEIVITFYLQHITLGHLLPYPFATKEAAEAHRTYLGAQDRYTIYEQVQKTESEDEREARIDNELFDDQIQKEWESYHV